MQIVMPVSTSVNVFSLALINRTAVPRKSLALAGDVPAGDRKNKVFLAPRMPNVKRNHLFLWQGAEKETGMAPPHRGKRSGCMSAPYLCLLNSVSSMSSPYGTLTRRGAYRGEEEAAR